MSPHLPRLRFDPAPGWLAEGAPGPRVLHILTEAGIPARFVGGCVRNALIGAGATDIDVATPAVPERVVELARRHGLRVVPTGLDHGTVTVIVDGEPIEVTTLRRDVSTDGRRATVAFTDDWREDAERRDFTMNALYADGEGQVYDPLGTGVGDALDGRIRFIGDATMRIEEDRLRVLRFFRFHAWFGRGQPDETAFEACRRYARALGPVSPERIRVEIMKLLSAPDPVAASEAMEAAGVAEAVLAGPVMVDRLARLVAIEPKADKPDWRTRLAAFASAGPEALDRALRLSRAEFARLSLLREPVPEGAPRLVHYRLGEAAGARLLLARAEDPGDLKAAALAKALEGEPVPVFPLKGRDALALGVGHGPAVGELLAEVERWWIEGGLKADREACLARLGEAVAAAGAV